MSCECSQAILEQRAHGTDLFPVHPTFAGDNADRLVAQLER